MKQTEVGPPVIGLGSHGSLLWSPRKHIGASILRNLVWLLTGDGKDFDGSVYVDTPGLGEGRVRCRVCRPQQSPGEEGDKRVPLLMVLQGGGFILGQPEDGQKQDRQLSDELGIMVIDVDYAKAPRYPFPHALLQLVQVLRWAFSPAAVKLGINIDPSRCAIMGNSAGGNLTATLSLLLSFTEGPCAAFRNQLPAEFQQRAQVLLYPSVDAGLTYGDRCRRSEEQVQKDSLPIWAAELMEDCYLPAPIERYQLFVRPLSADGELLRQLKVPRALILTAGRDCLKEEADQYGAKLRDAGVEVTLVDYPLAKHGFSHMWKGNDFRPDDIQDCWARVSGALKQSFK